MDEGRWNHHQRPFVFARQCSELVELAEIFDLPIVAIKPLLEFIRRMDINDHSLGHVVESQTLAENFALLRGEKRIAVINTPWYLRED